MKVEANEVSPESFRDEYDNNDVDNCYSAGKK
jgi:hypothetical protein